MSTIENFATGDAIQYLVSTNGKSVHGKNLGLGPRTFQIGGYLSDTSLQTVSRGMLRNGLQARTSTQSSQASSSHPAEADEVDFEAEERANDFTPASTPGSIRCPDICTREG